MAPRPITCGFLVLLYLTVTCQASDPGIEIRVQPKESRLQLVRDGKPLLVYAFASTQYKPYVQELYSLSGENILRDAPADHLHHHGLMYAIRVNGVNFWEETETAGHQRHIRWLHQSNGRDASGRPQAGVTELIHWVPGAGARIPESEASALLIERRTLSLTLNEAAHEIALRWQSEFKPGPAANEVKLHGSAYNGLGLRLPAHWDRVAEHSNSEALPYTAEQKWDLTPARWAAVSHTAGAKSIMLALFGNPSNRGETRFFSMINPFTYLSVTQNLELSPQTYSNNETFSVDYLLLVYSEKKSSEFLNQRYQAWIHP